VFKLLVRVDKHQRFKSFIMQMTSNRLEHLFSNTENTFSIVHLSTGPKSIINKTAQVSLSFFYQ